VSDFTCEACGGKNARQQIRLGDLPPFLIVHANKYAALSGPSAGALVRMGTSDMHRFAVTHHTGHTPNSGHYTATVTSLEGMTYYCDDPAISPRPDLSAATWQNSFLIFLENPKACEQASNSAGGCGDADHAANSMEVEACGDIRPAPEPSAPDLLEGHVADMEVETCGDSHTAAEPSVTDPRERSSDLASGSAVGCDSGRPAADHVGTTDEQDKAGDEDDDSSDDEMEEDDNATAEQVSLQAAECRVTNSRHDDWLHRGPFLADLPWHRIPPPL
jgi:hypothetical protein